MKAEILTVGAEILAGDVVDTNARDISLALADLGIRVVRRVTVDDDIDAIARAVNEAARGAEVVMVTGGLGPTPDDLTREGVARAAGVPLRLRPELEEPLRARFRSYGHAEMPSSNLAQITLPDGSDPMANPLGTAPGFRLEMGGTALFALPGIPREMRRMLEESVVPWLVAHRVRSALSVRVLRTIGIGESTLVERFGEVLRSLEGIEVGYYPQLPGVNVKLTARARDASAAAAALDRAEARLREALGTFVVGTGNATLAGVVGELLLARGWTLGTAESCTGGEMAAAIVAVPGASRYFQRGVVAYARRSKIDLLGVPPAVLEAHGEVSEPTVRAMAEGMRARAGVDVAVATTGIAGPSGATEEKPVGLVWSAIAWPGGTRAWRTVHPGDRGMVIARSVAVDLNRLRLLLLGST